MTSKTTPTSSGFSLIELLIVGGLLALIFISVSSLMMASLTSSIKTTLWQELRNEGSYAMTQMVYLIRNSNGLLYEDYASGSCVPTSAQHFLQFDNPDDTKSALIVDSTSSQNILNLVIIDDADDFATAPNPITIPLLSDSVILKDSQIFTCSSTAEQPYVKIAMTLVKSSDTLGDISQEFRRTVVIRNQ